MPSMVVPKGQIQPQKNLPRKKVIQRRTKAGIVFRMNDLAASDAEILRRGSTRRKKSTGILVNGYVAKKKSRKKMTREKTWKTRLTLGIPIPFMTLRIVF